MTSWVHRLSERARLALLTVAPILIVLALLILLPPDGSERAAWAQFIGRFHPLAVHLPIALILLVPILELAGRNSRFHYLRPSAAFVLGLATLSSIMAAILGWCLARSGGYSGPLMTQHMWSGLALTTVCWLCWVLRGHDSGGRRGILYPIALASALGLMTWTGYRGGQLSRGEDHLTEFMPAGLRKLLGLSAPAASSTAGEDTFFGARIQPIFAGHCFACHGPDRHKANLRLDSYHSVMRGGKNGPVVKAGNTQGSELFRRITLPTTDDDFMPKEGKRSLSADDVTLIKLWIAAGASATQPADAIQGAPIGSAATSIAPEVRFEKTDFAAVANLRATLAPTVTQLQKRFPNILDYESRGSADLLLNVSPMGARFGDADLVALAPVAEHIVVADFSRTAITDRSAPAIAAMKRLRVLRLVHTKITDTAVQALGGLDQLETLSVFGTAVTPTILPVVARLPKLRHLYAGETTIRDGMSLPAALHGKVLF
jgi:uncharacterized membrane protein